MFETVLVLVIVAVAAILVGRSFYRSTVARVRGCACTEECPLSEKCNPEAGECVENVRARKPVQRKSVTN